MIEITEAHASEAIRIARENEHMERRTQFAKQERTEAELSLNKGDFRTAYDCAMSSIRFSRGYCSETYETVAALTNPEKWRVIVIGRGPMQSSGKVIEFPDAESAEYAARWCYGATGTAVETDTYGYRTPQITVG